MRIGITGHQHLDEAEGWGTIRRALDRQLRGRSEDLVGYSSLAAGADQLFAQAILDVGGELVAVVPFAGYEVTFGPDSLADYTHYIGIAKELIVLSARATPEESYLAAGRYIVDHVDLLIAIWDGRPSAGLGGTADIVQYATSVRRDMVTISASAWR